MEANLQQHSQQWLEYFHNRGFPLARPLAAGMESAVYALGPGDDTDIEQIAASIATAGLPLVAKVSPTRTLSHVKLLQSCYTQLRQEFTRLQVPYALPEIIHVETIRGLTVSYELELDGRALHDPAVYQASSVWGEKDLSQAATATLQALQALNKVTFQLDGHSTLLELTVFDETEPPWKFHRTWSQVLTHLIARRTAKYRPQLQVAVSDFDCLLDRLLDKVENLNPSLLTVVHGDIFPMNLMINTQGNLNSIIDFGFLSTVGDPIFDASIAAGIFGVFNPHGAAFDRELTVYFSQELGYDTELMLLYRAVYAVIASNVYTSSGGDGQFVWCTDQLNRHDVRDVIFS